MGGLVIPSATGRVPDTQEPHSWIGSGGAVRCGTAHQVYQLFGRPMHISVHDGGVELPFSRQLQARGVQSSAPLVLRLGAAPDQPTYQLVPRRWRKKDEKSLGHLLPNLPGPLQV